MGIQSFKFSVDFFNNLEQPVIYIANKFKKILNAVAIYDGLKLTCNLNAFQTAEFKIYRDIDGKKQDYFNDFEEGMLIMIPGISWYEIHVETNIDNTGISKTISATSLECKLCDKRLVDFQVNSDDFEDDDYVITTFYNPTEPKKSLLDRALNVTPNWTVGHVDQSLVNKQRTFNEDDINVYSFLTETVSEAFNCLFIFDTFNQTVNAYDLNNYGNDTNIFVSMDNLAQNMTETIDQRSIFTCYRVVGGDGVYINEVNPNGTNKIYNFEYYLSQMPNDLQTKIKQYNAKYQELKPQYEDIVKRIGEQIAVIQDLNTRYPDSLASKDWTLYGLSGLETYKKSFETQNELFCAQGMNKPESLNYNLYQQNLTNLNEVTNEYNKRVSEINDATNVYQSIVGEMKSLQSELDMNVWFTEDEWKILDSYVIEETYTNDNFSVVDNTKEAELFSMEKELYDKAYEDLSKKCRPQYQYSATLTNILTIPEFKDFVQYFELGNFIRMETDYDTIVKLRLISFTVDYTNTQTIDVTFSDAVRVKNVLEDHASILAQAHSLASSFKFRKDQYDNSVKQGNFIAEMRKYGLDVATTQIYNATDQSQTWDSTGMTFRKWNDERQDFDPEMIKIINNMMVFLDGENGARMAIGKLKLPNGSETYGVNCEILMNKLTVSENVWIENNSGNYKFDDSGFTASNGVNTVKIQPNNSGELFSIYKGSNKQFYINSDGDVEFAGSLKSASGQFAGLVSGGSIDIGNGTFTVDKNGNVTASSGTFGGLVSGGSININNKFMVDKYGNVEALSGVFSGDITGSRGTFSGDIKANKINISRNNSDNLGDVNIRSGFGYYNVYDGEGAFGDYYGGIFSNPAIYMSCIQNGQFASTMLTNNAYVVTAQNIALNGNITCHGIDILNAKNFTDIIKSMHMNAIYEASSYGYGTDSLISFRQYYDSRSYHYNDKDYCATTAKYVHEYVKAKINSIDIPDMSDYLEKDAYGKFNADFADKADFATTARYCENTATQSHTANMYSNSSNKMYYCPQGSARRFKTDIDVVTDENLDPHKLYDIDVVQFKYKPSFYHLPDNTEMPTVIGMIADDIDNIYPCACEYDEDTGEVVNWLERYMIPPMLYLIQEHHSQIDGLQNEVNDLKQLVNKLLERDSV